MDSSLQLHEVSFSFLPTAVILKGITLAFKPGEFVGIVGPNASGKTTLARLLNGNLLPTSGEVTVNGLLSSLPENQLALKRLVTLIHSDAENQLIAPTVWDEILFALQVLGIDEYEIRRRAEAALTTFALGQYRDRHPYYLSVGEQFRLLLAAGFVRQPGYFVLDEVLSMMDAHTRRSTLDLLLSLRAERNVGIILLTHRLEDLFEADRIVVLQKGQVKADGPVHTIMQAALSEPDWNVEIPPLYRIFEALSLDQKKRMTELLPWIPLPG